MKVSRTKFVIIFLVSGFIFQFITNSLLGSEVGLFPLNAESYLGIGSPVAWKNAISTILLPIKIVLLGPLSFLFELPDPPPPFLVIAFAAYWTVLALIFYYLLSKISIRKRV